MAKEVERASGAHYIAGLWWEDLVKQLLWEVRDYAQTDGERSRYCVTSIPIPTWSWAHVNGEIVYSEIVYGTEDATETEHCVAIQPPRRWNTVSESVEHTTKPLSLSGIIFRHQPGRCPIVIMPGMRGGGDKNNKGIHGDVWSTIGWDDSSPGVALEDLRYLLVQIETAPNDSGGRTAVYLRCLALAPVHGERGTYRRVGLIRSSDSDIIRYFESPENRCGIDDYVDDTGQVLNLV